MKPLLLMGEIDVWTIAILSAMALLFAVNKFSKKKFHLSDMFEKNFDEIIEQAAFISTTMEVLSLSFMALDRGVPMIVATTRYGTLGFAELTMTFLFMKTANKAIEWKIKKVVADGKIHPLEILTSFLLLTGLIILFLICSLPTYGIAQLYFESIGSLKFVHNAEINPLYQMIFWQTEMTPENVIHPELAAIIMIYFTPFLNILKLIIEITKKAPKIYKEELEKALGGLEGVEEEKDAPVTTPGVEEEQSNSDTFFNNKVDSAAQAVFEIFEIPKATVKRNILNAVSGYSEVSSIVDAEEMEKKKKTEAVKLCNTILGSGPSNNSTLSIKTLKDLKQTIDSLNATLRNTREKLSALNRSNSDTGLTDQEKRELSREIAENTQLKTAQLAEIQEKNTEYDNSKDDLEDMLTSLSVI